MPGAIAQGLIWGLTAIGVYLTYKILDVADLTVDGSLCTGAAVCAVLITAGVHPLLAVLAALAAGAAAGTVTGLLHVFLGIPAILAGILTQMALWSVNLLILNGKSNVPLSARSNRVLLSLADIPHALLVALLFTACLIALLYLFFGTEFGAAIRATGSGPIMSRAQGINTDLTKVVGIALSNGIVALGGALLAQYQGFADINMGRGAIVIGLAAVVIGGAIVSRLRRNFALSLAGVSVGAIVYYVVYQAVIALGLDTNLLKMLSAVVVAVFLGVPYVRKKLARSAVRKGETKCSN